MRKSDIPLLLLYLDLLDHQQQQRGRHSRQKEVLTFEYRTQSKPISRKRKSQTKTRKMTKTHKKKTVTKTQTLDIEKNRFLL